jgi:hypothetical protein
VCAFSLLFFFYYYNYTNTFAAAAVQEADKRSLKRERAISSLLSSDVISFSLLSLFVCVVDPFFFTA